MKTIGQTLRAADAMWNTLGHAQNEPIKHDACGNVTHVCAATAVMSVPDGDRAGAFRALTIVMHGIAPTFNKEHTLAEVRAKFIEAAELAESGAIVLAERRC